jgi:hypothetical protein
MVACMMSSVGFVVRWKGKIWCLLLSGIFFVSMQVIWRLTRILGPICKKGINITPKFVGMPRTINCMFPIPGKCCCPSCKWAFKKKGKEGYAICHNFALVATRMSHDEIRGNESYIWILGSILKKTTNVKVITLVGPWQNSCIKN